MFGRNSQKLIVQEKCYRIVVRLKIDLFEVYTFHLPVEKNAMLTCFLLLLLLVVSYKVELMKIQLN